MCREKFVIPAEYLKTVTDVCMERQLKQRRIMKSLT